MHNKRLLWDASVGDGAEKLSSLFASGNMPDGPAWTATKTLLLSFFSCEGNCTSFPF